MNWKGFGNWLLSAACAGAATFATAAFGMGIPTKASLVAAGSAAVTAAINHLREHPWGGS